MTLKFHLGPRPKVRFSECQRIQCSHDIGMKTILTHRIKIHIFPILLKMTKNN